MDIILSRLRPGNRMAIAVAIAAVSGAVIYPVMSLLLHPSLVNGIWQICPPFVISYLLFKTLPSRIFSGAALFLIYTTSGVLSFFFLLGLDY